MAPESAHQPTLCGEEAIGVGVTSYTSSNFVSPELRIRLGPRAMNRAAVPVAAINEHSDLCWPEDDVGASPASLYHLPVHPEAQASGAARTTRLA